MEAPAIAIRPARLEDFEEIYGIFQFILNEGGTYSYTTQEMTPERSLAYWISAPGTHCFVADVEGKVAAVAAIRPNRTGRAGHVANASFIVDPQHRGKGLGRSISSYAIDVARQQGYKAMQFNFVVSVNETALALYQSLGFVIVGTLPKGFEHASKGLIDVHIMHRFL